MKTCMYLRKSRADEELEKINPGNTLSRHKDTLLKVVEEKKLSVIKIHEEIVSGESLNQRPAMLQLLAEVSDNLYDAVLVMDMDRLGRGNMQEQGLILDTFKQSKTVIITPRKTYDLNDEFDEEYSEFEAFMARKELKIITRRMQRGRLKSIEEGNYIGTYAPYGYKISGQGRGRSLEIDTDTAPVVKFIFENYAKGDGGNRIAQKLNNMGYQTSTGKEFYSHSILNIIKNPTYTGKVTWNKKSYKQGDISKRRTVKLNEKDDWIVYEGKHEPIISEELFNLCQSQLNSKTHVPYKTTLTNPLAGIVICSACGKPMVYRPYTKGPSHLICANHICKKNQSSKFDLVENAILEQLKHVLDEYKLKPSKVDDETDLSNDAIINVQSELNKIEIQKARLHDLLEQGIYDIDTFISRSEIINEKSQKLKEQLNQLEQEKPIMSNSEIAATIETILDAYIKSDDITVKNQIMKEAIESIIYSKEKGSKPNDFKLFINLRI